MQTLWSLVARVFLALSLFTGAAAVWAADAEPTINQVYAAAQAGKLDEAQLMVQQVLIAHPKSAKAFYVQAELYARQGDVAHARKSLANAEQYAPGLPFAKPESVQALRAQLNQGAVAQPAQTAPATHYDRSPPPRESSSSWLMPVLLAAAVIFIGYLLFKRRSPAQGYDVPDQMGQTYGPGGVPMQPSPYGGYPQQQPGLGSRIAGGVATGLAVGAGVLAAEAIGRKLMGGDDGSAHASSHSRDSYEPLSGNNDMGGNDFGISDTSSWDSGGSDGGGGGDWD